MFLGFFVRKIVPRTCSLGRSTDFDMRYTNRRVFTQGSAFCGKNTVFSVFHIYILKNQKNHFGVHIMESLWQIRDSHERTVVTLRGHSRSLEMTQFDRSHTSSYSYSIATVAMPCIVSKIKRDICLKSRFFILLLHNNCCEYFRTVFKPSQNIV